ncbi:membrane-associated phospholipid phosphatase [Pontibacter sp. HSC-36F09]|nr:membrane-associated phospholipid phosphatase [Pontibacter sp. HSC-36F09]
MPTYLFAIILYFLPVSSISLPLQSRWIVLSMIFFTTFMVPGLGAFAMFKTGFIDSYEIDRREQRSRPLLFTALCYGVTTYLFYSESVFDLLFYFVMGVVTASVLVAWCVSFFWKISAHGIGLGGALGVLLLMNKLMPESGLLIPIVLLVLVSGAVLSARLALHAHTPAQAYTGFLTGLLLVLLAGFVAL